MILMIKFKKVFALSLVSLLMVGCNNQITNNNTNQDNQGSSVENNTNDDNNNDNKTNNTEKNVKVVSASNKTMQYETYKTEYVSIKKPKNWKVQEDLTTYGNYVIRIYDPNNEDYQIFFNLKIDGFTKSKEAKNYYATWQKNSPQALLPALQPATVEHYFELFDSINQIIKSRNNNVSYYPALKNFTKLAVLGKSSAGGDIIRANYTGVKSKLAEGLFTATIKDVGTIKNGNLDVGYYIVYYTAFITTPKDELINYESNLLDCLKSLSFTSKFETGFYNELKQNNQTANFNRAQAQSISEGIMDSWNKRQKSLDIQSQKSSDATLGYERVYDTETGDIYKAYNGFSDDYKGSRYKTISDSQYTEPIAGYIEK